MPEINRPSSISVKYSVPEIGELIRNDLKSKHNLEVIQMTPVFTGGGTDCDCASWGGPTMCNCKSIPAKLSHYSITAREIK